MLNQNLLAALAATLALALIIVLRTSSYVETVARTDHESVDAVCSRVERDHVPQVYPVANTREVEEKANPTNQPMIRRSSPDMTSEVK